MNPILERSFGEKTLVELSGKLDASTTPAIEARLLELIQEGKKFMVIDFGAVNYLASSGLRMLLVALRHIQKLEGHLVLCQLSQTMQDTMDVTGFLPYFQISATQAEALARLEI